MRIVRILWGADRHLVRWARLWRDVTSRIALGTQCEQSVYVYGKDSADRLMKINDPHYKIILVDDSPYPFDIYDEQLSDGMITRPWRYKHELIKCAVRDHGPVIYCDWDVDCMVKDVPAAFAQVEQSRFRLSAFRYKKGVHHQPNREGYARQIATSGSWIYTSDAWFIDQVLAAMANEDDPRRWHDEWVMGDLIDKWNGGWPGESFWLQHYESPIMVQHRGHNPWPLVCYDEETGTVVRKTPIPFVWNMLFLGRGLFRCVDEQFEVCAF